MNTCCTEQGLLLELKGICHPVPSSDAVTDDCMLLVSIQVLSDDWLVFADWQQVSLRVLSDDWLVLIDSKLVYMS